MKGSPISIHREFWGLPEHLHCKQQGQNISNCPEALVGSCRSFSSKRIQAPHSEKVVAIRWPLRLSAPLTNKITCLCLSRAPFSPGGQALHFFLRATLASSGSHPILLTNYLSLSPRVGKSLNFFVSPLPHLYCGEKTGSTSSSCEDRVR